MPETTDVGVLRAALREVERGRAAAEAERDEAIEALRFMVVTLRYGDQHDYMGRCPDPTQPDARDARCPTCQALVAGEKVLGGDS
jgi:hypothetical protein